MEVNGITGNNDLTKYQYENHREISSAADEGGNDIVSVTDSDKKDSYLDQNLTEDDKQKRMQRLQDTLKNHNVEISYNEEVNRYAIKVLDADTKEVVREIPSEKTLDMFARMLEIEGLLLDEKR